jgi:hypothetical protein
VKAWTLAGRGGLKLEAIPYGGIVTRLLAPERNGNAGDNQVTEIQSKN